MNSTVKTLFLWMAIFVVVILLWNTFQNGKSSRADLGYSEPSAFFRAFAHLPSPRLESGGFFRPTPT